MHFGLGGEDCYHWGPELLSSRRSSPTTQGRILRRSNDMNIFRMNDHLNGVQQRKIEFV